MTVKTYAHTDKRLSDVYGRSFGWRMFDSRYLTPAVADFLGREKSAFLKLMASSGYEDVIEVGAGYGRYGRSVVEQGINYTGIDLITWLQEIGTWYADKAQLGKGAPVSYTLRNMSVVDIAGLFPAGKAERRTVVFFPFNCVGNLEYIGKILEELRELDLDFACSVFNNTAATGASRAEYYAQCGLSELQTQTLSSSCCEITSAEGFESVGYNPLFLEQLFRRHGYVQASAEEIATMGRLVHFRKDTDLPKAARREISPEISKYGALSPDEVEACLTGQSVRAVYYLDWTSAVTDSGYDLTGLMPFSVVETSDWKAVTGQLAAQTESDIAPVCVIEAASADGKKRFYYPVRF